MNYGQSPPPVTSKKQPRLGLFKIRINSNHMIKCPDGIIRQFNVKDLTRHPKAERVAVCLRCGKQWASEEELLAAHPENRILAKQKEIHPYGYWSEEPLVGSKKDPGKVLGLLSDED